MLFQNITLIDANSPLNGQKKDLQVKGNSIVKIGEPFSILDEEEEIIHGKNLCLSLGWIDMQLHLSSPGFEWKESLAATAQAALKGGFTHVLCYPTTLPCPENAQVLGALQNLTPHLPVTFLFAGALTQQTEGKTLAALYEMHLSGAAAFTDGLHYPSDTGVLLRTRQYLSVFNGLLIIYPHDKYLVKEGMMNEGAAAVHLGLKGVPEIAEVIGVEKEILLHSYAPIRTHIQPITSAKALASLAAAKAASPLISVGIPSYYLALSDTALFDFDTHTKVFPPLRSQSQISEVITHIQNGTVDVITSGHLPQGLEEKQTEWDVAENGMLNLQTCFPIAYEALVASRKISLSDLIVKFTTNPRHILGLPALALEEGGLADLTLFSIDTPTIFSSQDIPSTAKNSPFIGKSFSTKIWGTYSQGKWNA